MKTDLSNDKKFLTLEEAKAEFLRKGESVAEWARKYGFYPQRFPLFCVVNAKGYGAGRMKLRCDLGLRTA